MHLAHEYNAAKRREYYLRNRHLKGRRPGVTPVNAAARRAAAKAAKIRKRKALQAKVHALQARLEKLRDVLKVMVAKAQKKSGAKPAAKRKDSTPEHQSAKQKAAAKKASEKYAKTHKAEKDQTLSQQVKSLNEKIKTIEERIKKLRAKN